MNSGCELGENNPLKERAMPKHKRKKQWAPYSFSPASNSYDNNNPSSRSYSSPAKEPEPEPAVEEYDAFDMPELPQPEEWLRAGETGQMTAEVLQHVYLGGACVCKTSAKHSSNCEGNAYCLRGFAGIQCGDSAYDVGFDPLSRACEQQPKGAAAFEELVAKHDAAGILALMRDPKKKPAGLRNLGQTCYLNAFLQSMFAIAPFRSLVYQWSREDQLAAAATAAAGGTGSANQEIMEALQALFARMEQSTYAAADPQRLVSALEVDPHVQQDPQEFARLFLSLVAEQLDACGLGTELRLMLDGAEEYATTCSACKQTSLTPHSFSELALPLKAPHACLDKSLRHYTAEEPLTGANQYRCGKCGQLADATRRVRVRELPPVLSVQLMRFQFNVKTMTKVKKRDFYSFPRIVDLQWLLQDTQEQEPPKSTTSSKTSSSKTSPASTETTETTTTTTTETTETRKEKSQEEGEKKAEKSKGSKYELFAVLVHRGETANGGHYVCYASPGGAGRWYEFDDTRVTDVSDLVGALFDEHGARVTATGCRLHEVWAHDAYALMYRRVGRAPEPPVVPEWLAAAAVTGPDADAAAFVSALRCSSDEAHALCLARRELADEVAVSSKRVADAPAEQLRFVSAEWLQRFMAREQCGPIDNSALLCAHGRLSPAAVAVCGKCVLPSAWERLAACFGGGPELTLCSSACLDCVREACRQRVDAQQAAAMRKAVVEHLRWQSSSSSAGGGGGGKKGKKKKNKQAAAKRARPVSPETGRWVSSEWLDCWCQTDQVRDYTQLTGLITCKHGELVPEASARRLVCAEVWAYFQSLAEAAGVALREYPGSSATACNQCAEERERDSAIASVAAKERADERKRFDALLRNAHQTELGEYYLIDKEWYSRWKRWLQSTAATDAAPEKLDCRALLCPHSMVAYNPSDYVSSSSKSACKYAAVPASLWPALRDKYAVPGTPEIKMTLVAKAEPELSCGTCWECMFKEEDEAEAARKKDVAGKLTLLRLPGTYPTPKAVLAAAQAASEQKDDSKAPQSDAAAAATAETGGRREGVRRSARIAEQERRKQASRTTKHNVDGVDLGWSVHGLKMHIFATDDGSIDCGPPEKQVLVCNGQLLDDDKQLADCSLEFGKTVVVVGVLGSSSTEGQPSTAAAQERGFAGSRLVSARPASAPAPITAAAATAEDGHTPSRKV